MLPLSRPEARAVEHPDIANVLAESRAAMERFNRAHEAAKAAILAAIAANEAHMRRARFTGPIILE